MDKKLLKAINEQIKNELYSAYLYLSMAAYSESINLPGFAHWMKAQAGEEQEHAMKLFGFLIDKGERVVLQALDKPPADFGSAKGIFEETLKHENKVTALIDRLYELAVDVGDNAASIFLQWFVTEQVEEEKNATEILEQLKVVKADSPALLMLDNVLAKRAAD
ncbi:ferritin [Candidatus Omnitrophota bacterium]